MPLGIFLLHFLSFSSPLRLCLPEKKEKATKSHWQEVQELTVICISDSTSTVLKTVLSSPQGCAWMHLTCVTHQRDRCITKPQDRPQPRPRWPFEMRHVHPLDLPTLYS